MKNYIIDITHNRPFNAFYLLLGLCSTTSLLSIGILGIYISLFSIVLILVFIDLFINQTSSSIYKNTHVDKIFYFWMLISIASSLFGFFYFSTDSFEWQLAALSHIPKMIIYTLLFYLLKKQVNTTMYVRLIAVGILWGAILNLIWALFDAAIYYSNGYSITNELFSGYINALDVRYGRISLTIGGTIRSCGLNIDPANIGFLAPLLASYALKSRKYYLFLLSFISIFTSLSHTAFVGILLVSILSMLTNVKKFLVGLLLLCIIAVPIGFISNNDNGVSAAMINAFVERTEAKEDSSSESTRANYILNFPKAVMLQPSSFLIGTGYFTSSYPYVKNKLASNYEPYDPENTYIATYFDCGMIGFIAFLLLYYSLFKKLRFKCLNYNDSHCYILCAGIESSLLVFLFYHYTIYSVIMLLTIISIIEYDKIKIGNFNNYNV